MHIHGSQAGREIEKQAVSFVFFIFLFLIFSLPAFCFGESRHDAKSCLRFAGDILLLHVMYPTYSIKRSHYNTFQVAGARSGSLMVVFRAGAAVPTYLLKYLPLCICPLLLIYIVNIHVHI